MEPERDPSLWPLSGAIYNGVLCDQSMLLDIFNMHANLHVPSDITGMFIHMHKLCSSLENAFMTYIQYDH